MPRRVKGPDGRVHQFPDHATDAQISAALKAVPQANQPQVPEKTPTWAPAAGRGTGFSFDRQAENANALLEQGPIIGGAVGGFAAGPPGAAIGGASGALVRDLARANRGDARTPTTGLEAATNVGLNAVAQGSLQKAGELVIGSMQKAAPWLMSKAIKPSAKLLNDYRTTALKISKTLLDDGINVSQSGLEKLQKLIFADNAEIQALANASTARIDKGAVIARVGEHVDDALRSQVNPGKSVRGAEKVVNEFIEHPFYKGDTISPAEAQKLKVGTYQQIGDAFNKPQKARAIKAMGRGLKEEIAEAVPGVAEINSREAGRLAGGEAVATAIQKDASSDPMGLLFAASSPSLFLAGLINKQPAIKSMLARGMYQTAAKAAGVPENVIRTAVYALAEGQEDEK